MNPQRLRCQHKYLNKRRCLEWTFRGGGVCRWHYILYVSQQWYGKIPLVTGQRLQLTASILLLSGLMSLRRFAMTTEVVWLLVAGLLTTTALCLISDSVIVLNLPLSRYTLWPKLLAAGMVLLIVVGAVSAPLLYARPQVVDPFVRTLRGGARMAETTPRVFLAVAVVLTLFVLKAFVQRILCYHLVGINSLLVVVAAAAGYLAFKPLIFQQQILSALMTDEFWQAATGPNNRLVNMVAVGVVFSLNFIIADLMLRMRLDKEQYGATLLPALAARLATLGASLLAARYLLVWSNVSGGVAYTILATAISLPLGVVTTKMVIGWALSRDASNGP